MILKCYSIYDKAVQAFMPPWYASTNGEALRRFMDEVARPDGQLGKHPEDYTLFQCGEWDDSKGVFTQEEPEKVITALECVKS